MSNVIIDNTRVFRQTKKRLIEELQQEEAERKAGLRWLQVSFSGKDFWSGSEIEAYRKRFKREVPPVILHLTYNEYD